MTAAVAGSNPASPVLNCGILAQSVEHLTFNQVVGGSNPPCLIIREKPGGVNISGFFICLKSVTDGAALRNGTGGRSLV